MSILKNPGWDNYSSPDPDSLLNTTASLVPFSTVITSGIMTKTLLLFGSNVFADAAIPDQTNRVLLDLTSTG